MSFKPIYRRVLLKISGESLAGAQRNGIDSDVLRAICVNIKRAADQGVQIGIVVGGGNYWRGRDMPHMERTRADHAGMLGTVMNGLAMTDCLISLGVDARLMTAIEMSAVAEFYTRNRAIAQLEAGCVIIFAAGTGNPYFTTDTTAALRAAEVGAQVVLLAKRIDGVYSDDPEKNPNAEFIPEITHLDMLNRQLGVMDATAATFCLENGLPILVFGIRDPNNILRAIAGERVGTAIRTPAQ